METGCFFTEGGVGIYGAFFLIKEDSIHSFKYITSR